MMIALIIGLVPHIYSVNYPSPFHRISILCKIRGYLGQSVVMMFRWLMTMACIDRFMLSSNDVYLREIANPRIAHSIIIKIVIICLILPVHNLIVLDMVNGFCIPTNRAFMLYYALFAVTFAGFLPILIMTICAILIHSNLASKRARRQRNIYQENEKGEVRLLRTRDHQVLLMLFIQIIVYIISIIPWSIFLLYGIYLYSINNNRSINRIIIDNFLLYLTEIFVYLYPTLSFYIYTLTSQTFRSELVNIISKLFIHKYRPPPVLQSLQMQVEGNKKSESVQSNKRCQFKSIEMETFLDCSQKI
jgi:hypothetical protein